MNRSEYYLTCLMEEAAEIQKACAKALRFGINDYWTLEAKTNQEAILAELNDLRAIVEALHEAGVLSNIKPDVLAIAAKRAKLERFMAYSRDQGCLQEQENKNDEPTTT